MEVFFTANISILGKNKSDSAFFVKDNKPAPGQYEAPTFLVMDSSNLENFLAGAQEQRVRCCREN